MALFLVQHGKSLSKDVDPEQGLSREGILETERIAEMAKEHGVHIQRINHSEKTRARQTAEIVASTLQPEDGVHEVIGLKPMDDVETIAAVLDSTDDLMLVGHLPFMERLTAYLITGSISPPALKFQNSGIVCLDKDPDSRTWMIIWALMPHIA